MCSSMKTCKRRCRSFTLLLKEKFMSAACLLFTRKSSGALLHKVRDTLFEILCTETRHHLAHRNVESFRERLRQGPVYLALDYAQRARAHRGSQFLGRLLGFFEKGFLRKNSIHEPHAKCFGGIDGPGGKQQVERVCNSNDPRQHPGHSILGNQPAPRECGAEAACVRSQPQIAIESDNQTKANRRSVDGGNHRLPDGGEIRVFLLKILGRAFTAVSAVAQNLLAAPVIQIPVIHAAYRHRAQQRHVSACAKAPPSACQY